jgi:cyclopropane-fatty-acyl-phospholipid synthase
MFAWLASEQTLLKRARNLITHVAPLLESRLNVRLWDGSSVPLGTQEPGPFSVAISSPGVISSLLRRPTLPNLFEHYATGRIAFEGGDLIAFGNAMRAKHLKGSLRKVSKWYLLRQLWPFLFHKADRSSISHAFEGSIRAVEKQRDEAELIQFHYDISTDFYKLFLGREMVYSCAYFKTPESDLDQAQHDKLEMICRKLLLQPGERFLDIGCGWGGLLCHAARHYGVQAHGVTLSREQFDYATAKVRQLGLEDRVTIELRDYATLQHGSYDKIASIGMYEHIRIANYPAYFGKLYSLLRDRGMLLNHGITRAAKKTPAEFRKMRPEQRLIHRYIFPGSELDHIGHTVEVMEGCRFEVHDVEGWREHYARTLALWCQRLSANRDQAIQLVGEEKFRTWVAYLAICSFSFQDGAIRIFQTVATKHAKKGLSGMPMTREHLYRENAEVHKLSA